MSEFEDRLVEVFFFLSKMPEMLVAATAQF